MNSESNVGILNESPNYALIFVGALIMIMGIFLPIENTESTGLLSAYARQNESSFLFNTLWVSGLLIGVFAYFRIPVMSYLVGLFGTVCVLYSLLSFAPEAASWGWGFLFLGGLLAIYGGFREAPPFIRRLINQRLLLAFLTLFVISILIFLGTEFLPGDVAQTILGQSATPENLAALRTQLGLDQPPLTRYLNWLSGIFRGDLGMTLTSQRPVVEAIGPRLGNTMFLAATAAVISIPLAILLGLLAVRFRDTWLDKTISTVTLTTISLPEFFVGYILILVFAMILQWTGSTATVFQDMGFWERLQTIALPVATLTFIILAYMMRMTRAALIGVMSSPYIEMATLKGVSPFNTLVRHALPNSIAPIANVIALNLAYLVVGVVVVEVVFVYPGMGQLMVDHVSRRDLPMVQACGIIFAAIYIGLNMLADIVAIIGNPKLRFPK